MITKTIRVTPTTTGIAASALLSTYFASIRRLGLLPVRHEHVLEPGSRARGVPGADVEVLDPLAHAPQALGEGKQRSRQILHQDLLDLLVEPLPLLAVERLDRLVQKVVDLRVLVRHPVQSAVADRLRMPELCCVRIQSLGDAQQDHLELAGLAQLSYELRELNSLGRHVCAHLLPLVRQYGDERLTDLVAGVRTQLPLHAHAAFGSNPVRALDPAGGVEHLLGIAEAEVVLRLRGGVDPLG